MPTSPINFQPSEFLKLAVLLASANLLAKRHTEMHDLRRTLMPVLGLAPSTFERRFGHRPSQPGNERLPMLLATQ